MASLTLWLLVAATLVWCGAAMRVSFSMARYSCAAERQAGAPKGKLKLAVIALFLLLPFVLLSALLPWANARVALNFTYCWVTPCKLLLLAFANFLLDFPLWSLSHFSHFLLAFLLPVRIKGVVKAGAVVCLPRQSLHSLLFDLCALIFFLSCYDSMVPLASHVVHCLVLYLVLDLPHRIASMALLLLCGVETQPAFCKPWLATSLTDFWGNRWDLTANALLRHSVYNPIVNLLITERRTAARPKNDVDIQLLHFSAAAASTNCRTKIHVEAPLTSTWSSLHAAPSLLVSDPSLPRPLPLLVRLIGVNITFIVSGLIHELLYFSVTQAAAPTWQVTAFFIVHGLATSAEITLRRACPKHDMIFKLPRPLKLVLTMCFMYATSAWLFFPQLVKADIFRKCTGEYRAIKEMMGMRSLYSNTLFTTGSHLLH